jgi:hypothetical protein
MRFAKKLGPWEYGTSTNTMFGGRFDWDVF